MHVYISSFNIFASQGFSIHPGERCGPETNGYVKFVFQ